MTNSLKCLRARVRNQSLAHIQVSDIPRWREVLLLTDAALAAIDPDYEVIQVKAKFGELRFYYKTSPGNESARPVMDGIIALAEHAIAAIEAHAA